MNALNDLGRLPQSGAAFCVANAACESLHDALRRQRPSVQLVGDRIFTLDRPDTLRAALPQDDVPIVPFYVEAPGFRMGKPIESGRWRALEGNQDRIAYLEWRISLLAELGGRTSEGQGAAEPIAAPVSRELLAFEIEALSPACRLASSGEFEVFLTGAERIPDLLREIGRLREITFRAAGEGTGRALDIDRFDPGYLHLFVWQREKREIVGAYRLSSTAGGPGTLYTATLFQYGREFLSRVGPALELGRSFVRVEYQRSFAPLLLMWKAIGRFVANNPRYKTLFGPVSISNQYSALSRELMIAFLEKREWLAGLADLVRPRSAPPSARQPSATYCRDLDDLADIVSDLEPGERGVPVLLRQYLRLGGKLLGFNVDPDFSNALDGLILVDLTRTEPRLLERYLGKAEAHTFLDYWKGQHGTL